MSKSDALLEHPKSAAHCSLSQTAAAPMPEPMHMPL
eukprot:CAMPEP_0176160986 /NCGR_PEP_ID=MMETSP0120_2-20121206/82357_1 /TAXON_ID=160619 /ORGANISM="Kryptoperidinium foliaceum, Strain CCMP 1326" /LENGTH=35 /DNA_ID= /DNA_START= /DNA_END= /DNA_ORIENTATION=